MGLLKQPIERKLSSVVGAEVSFDKLNLSVLGGSVEAQGVTVAGTDPATPLLTVRRVRAEISLGAALKKEFVVKSLTIEKPVLTIVRDREGRLNLPPRVSLNDAPADANKPARQTPEPASHTAESDANAGTWKLEAKKVLVIDAEAHFHDADGYHAAVEKLLAEVKEDSGGLTFTLLANSIGRKDDPIDLGELRANGRADDVPSLTKLRNAKFHISLELSDALRIVADIPTLKPLSVTANVRATADFDRILRLVPEGIPIPKRLRSEVLKGRADVSARASYSPEQGIRVPELTLRAADVILSPTKRPTTEPRNI